MYYFYPSSKTILIGYVWISEVFVSYLMLKRDETVVGLSLSCLMKLHSYLLPSLYLCWKFCRMAWGEQRRGKQKRKEERRWVKRRLGLLHQQHFRRTLSSWHSSHAAWQVQRVDRWCGDGAGMVLWDDAQWPCGIARSSYGMRRVCVPTVTTAYESLALPLPAKVDQNE